jgi:peptidoglycan/LPS O-acetylase OafA/YrhL
MSENLLERSAVANNVARTPPEQHSRLQALDGLRAIALTSVLVHHYAPVLFSGGTPVRNFLLEIIDLGGLGVDLFFALSGFLITGILYDSLGESAYLRRFYWRRSLRIFPAYFAFLVPFLFKSQLFEHLSRWGFILYLRNWMGPDPISDNILGHLWSLAVEEQFYIVWAPVVCLCSRRQLPWLILILSASALLFRGEMISVGYSRYDQLRFTPARLDSLLLGGFVAIAWRTYRWSVVKCGALCCSILSAAGFTAIFVWKGTLENRLAELILPSLSAIFFASIVALCLTVRKSFLTKPLLANIAKYSYAMYLWHLVPHIYGQRILKLVDHQSMEAVLVVKLLYIPGLFLATYVISRASWTFIEEPFLGLKDWMYSRRTSLPT